MEWWYIAQSASQMIFPSLWFYVYDIDEFIGNSNGSTQLIGALFTKHLLRIAAKEYQWNSTGLTDEDGTKSSNGSQSAKCNWESPKQIHFMLHLFVVIVTAVYTVR